MIYEESFSDLAIIAVHYPERFEVDEICEAFVKAQKKRATKGVGSFEPVLNA